MPLVNTTKELDIMFLLRLVSETGKEALGIKNRLNSFYLELPRTTVVLVH